METIAAIATPPGIGAIGLIRVSGPDALLAAKKLFKPVQKELDWKPNRAYPGTMEHEGLFLDQVILTYFKAPHSYTGEDSIEVTCHGGPHVLQRVIDAFFACEVIPAQPGAFTERAFLNGKMDLLQAEAVADMIHADSNLALEAAKDLLQGTLTNYVTSLKNNLIALASGLEAEIEFPDESDVQENLDSIIRPRLDTIEKMLSDLKKLSETYEQGRHLREGFKAVLCGAPNTGKSTLMNALMGFERSLISDQPGTTRDYIQEKAYINGLPVTLIDMAGIRHQADAIEQQGINQAKSMIAQAELALLIRDVSRPETPDDILALEACPEHLPKIWVLNKNDLPHQITPSDLNTLGAPCVFVSAKEGTGLPDLAECISQQLHIGQVKDKRGLVITHARHSNSITACIRYLEKAGKLLQEGDSLELVVFEIRQALRELQVLTGEITIDDILQHIFSHFCIGK